MLVVNQAVTGAAADSITKLNFTNVTQIISTNTISLPANSAPNFVAVAPSATTAYVTLPNLNEVGVVSTSNNYMGQTITVGNNPYALAVTPDNTKFYVANYSTPCTSPPTAGICSISAFNTAGLSTRVISGSLSSPPIWLSARSDSQALYVLEANGTLAFINILSSSGPDTPDRNGDKCIGRNEDDL